MAATLRQFKSLWGSNLSACLEKEMVRAAKDLEFEKAAELRDEIKALQKLIVLET